MASATWALMTKVPTVCVSRKGGGHDRDSISMEPRGIHWGKKSAYVDFEHLFKVGDAIHHVVGPFLLDGDTGAVNAS
jgi:hypothetical protein